jgi:hypothetical protein
MTATPASNAQPASMRVFVSPAIGRTVVALGAAILLAMLTPAAAHAQRRDDGATAETLGAADAVRASVWGPAALTWNPAGLLKIPVMLVQANYGYLEGQNGHAFQAGVVDGRTSEFAALGITYNYVSAERDGYDRTAHQVRLGLGTGYRADDIGIFAGFGARYLDLRMKPLDAGTPAFPDGNLDAWTLDIGLMFDFADRIRFGVVGQNLLDVKHSEALRTLGIGLSFVFSTLEIGAVMDLDLSGRLDRTITSYAFGADYGFADAFRVRAGLILDELQGEQRATAGFGWSNPSVAVDLGWSTAVTDPTNMIVQVSVRYVPSL